MLTLVRVPIQLKDRHYKAIFLLPMIVCLVVYSVFPLVYTLVISFFNWDLIKQGSEKNFVGFYNYISVLGSGAFWHAIIVTLEYTVASVAISMILGMALAFLFYQELFSTWIVRTVVLSAMVISPVVVGTLWRLMYNPDVGIITFLFESIGIRGTSFLANNKTVLGALIFVDVWEWTPLVSVIILAGLQGMPSEVFEAGIIDGCSAFKTLTYITLPLLKPSILLALLMRIMDSFRTFDTIYAMTGGGPGTESQNLNILMYNTGFEFFQMSKVSAMAILSLMIVLAICTFTTNRLRKGDNSIW